MLKGQKVKSKEAMREIKQIYATLTAEGIKGIAVNFNGMLLF
jgi:hypothetical protein